MFIFKRYPSLTKDIQIHNRCLRHCCCFFTIMGLFWVFLVSRFFFTLTLKVYYECLFLVCALFFSSFPYFLLLPLPSFTLVIFREWDSFKIFFLFFSFLIFGQRNVNLEWPSNLLSKELSKPLIFFFFG